MSITTHHELITGDSRKLKEVANHSVDLIVTSPPYPMIAMWDEIFHLMNSKIGPKLISNDGKKAYEMMHLELDKVWQEVNRVLKPGGMACINIGDATRTVNTEFRLYPNHSRIIESFVQLGFNNLPNVIWKKPTNSPNKFMGSGTLPVGAYVTLEHEYILVFRKGEKRKFPTNDEKAKRLESAFFWEERNRWFSDTWDLKGISQKLLNQNRSRSAAYPVEVPHRLINMYSLIGDTVLDPFNGTGTTTMAAIANTRNSIGFDIDKNLLQTTIESTPQQLKHCQLIVNERLQQHKKFVAHCEKGSLGHHNKHYNFPVKTRQETTIKFPVLDELTIQNDTIIALYK